jgi:hypothetical protein
VGLDPWFDGKAEGSVFATLSSRTPAVAQASFTSARAVLGSDSNHSSISLLTSSG